MICVSNYIHNFIVPTGKTYLLAMPIDGYDIVFLVSGKSGGTYTINYPRLGLNVSGDLHPFSNERKYVNTNQRLEDSAMVINVTDDIGVYDVYG
jgi:hypothetical protein